MASSSREKNVRNAPPAEVQELQERRQPETQHVDEEEELSDIEYDLNVTEDDLLEAREIANQLSLEETKVVIREVFKLHRKDPNFPLKVICKAERFLFNDEVFEKPEKHVALIREMKLEAALITSNSPYAEVRAVVDNHDDLRMPCSTLRAWLIGLMFSAALPSINQLFSIRQPKISVGANVAQLLAYPLGKFLEFVLPDVGFTLWGVRHSLNPGPFSRKEHMLITIMANVAQSLPNTNSLIFVQFLPEYLNQAYASQFSYQILIGLSTSFIGYGMAGIFRRFLVYPSYCIWPSALVTIALNSAFHTKENSSVLGPFRTVWRASRFKFFMTAFVAMFLWFWFPSFIWTSLYNFSWLTWISPKNRDLDIITGFGNGVGLNPWPTFDWNVLTFDDTDPLMVPFFSTLSKFVGALSYMFVVLGFWYTNTFNTGYLPIISSRVYDNQARLYSIYGAVDEKGLFSAELYEQYSPPFLSAGAIVSYMADFATYAGILTYVCLYYRQEIIHGIRSLLLKLRRRGQVSEIRHFDVHTRLMSKYQEVPGWWYMVVLVISIALGIGGIAGWETYTSPGVVFYGILLCIIFVVPVGIIKAMTGVEVQMTVLAEFIGGSIVPGNALAMNYFRTYGYMTCWSALTFSSDLKLAHYLKIPPRQTFCAQIIATLLSTFVCTGILNFQLNMPDICTPNAKWKLICPGINSFFTDSILWGTVGPKKLWGVGGQYASTLVGFPVGVVVVLSFYALDRQFPKAYWLRQLHPVLLIHAGTYWMAYNMSFIWPSVPIAWISWMYLKPRFLGFWSKYNYVLSAAFSCGIAISAIVIYFAIYWKAVDFPSWWGNDVVNQGCESNPCTLKELENLDDYFGPRIGHFH